MQSYSFILISMYYISELQIGEISTAAKVEHDLFSDECTMGFAQKDGISAFHSWYVCYLLHMC